MYSSWPLLSGISLKGTTSSLDAALVFGGGDLLRAFFEDCAGESLVGKGAGEVEVVSWWVSALFALGGFMGSFRFIAIAGETVLTGETFPLRKGEPIQECYFLVFGVEVKGGVFLRSFRLRCDVLWCVLHCIIQYKPLCISFFFQDSSGHCSRQYDLNTKNQMPSLNPVRRGHDFRWASSAEMFRQTMHYEGCLD